MARDALVAGVGMIPFAKPAAHAPYPDMAAQAVRLALASGAADCVLALGFYHRSVCVGDTVTVRSRIDDIYDKKNGALEFVVKTSPASDMHNVLSMPAMAEAR